MLAAETIVKAFSTADFTASTATPECAARCPVTTY